MDNELIPIAGRAPTDFLSVLAMLERPYTPISPEFYAELVERQHDYYYTNYRVVTFGFADGGYALMPLAELHADRVLENAGRADLMAEIKDHRAKLAETKRVVRMFANQVYAHSREVIELFLPSPFRDPKIDYPQQWLEIAQASMGVLPKRPDHSDQRHEIATACNDLARALFHIPGGKGYVVPDQWAETPMGRLWHLAMVWAYGDKLCTLKEAAEILGTSTSAVHGHIARGNLRVFVNSNASVKGRRLVLRSELEKLRKEKKI